MIRQNKYRKVKELPRNAMSVTEWATKQKYSINNVYKRWKVRQSEAVQIGRPREGDDFDIVEFKNRNYVIPLN